MTIRLLPKGLMTLAAIVGVAAGGFAQAPVETDADITVTGRREALTNTLKAVLSETGFDQIGRFEEPVCPGVAGLDADEAALIVGIIRANAQEAGMTLLEEGCRPNAVAVFVSDPAALVRGWKTRDRTMFGTMTEAEIDALAARPGPVLSWRIVETMRYDGGRPERAESVEGVTAAKPPLVIRNALATRNQENVRQDITMSIAAIDMDSIRGKTLQQLADFATLHLFLDLSPEAAERAGDSSMLSLFSDRPAGAPLPTSLSAFDRGMLKGLYGERRNNFDSHRQRERMVRQITRQMRDGD